MPDPTRIFRRLRRKILPHKARKWLSNFVWRTSGVTLEIGGLVVALWGLLLIFKSHPVENANGILVTDWTQSLGFLIIGLGVFALGFSITKLYRHSQGQIDSRFVKDDKPSKE